MIDDDAPKLDSFEAVVAKAHIGLTRSKKSSERAQVAHGWMLRSFIDRL